MTNTTTLSPRRSFINLAEAIKTANVSDKKRTRLAAVQVEILTGTEGFDATRFLAHALGTHGDQKFAYNALMGTGPTA